MEPPEKDTAAEKAVFGENVVIKIGSVVAFLTVFGWGIWWASGVQSDLNTIKGTLSNFNKLDSLTGRVQMIEQYGSPQVITLEKSVLELKKDFELHKAVAGSK